MLKNKVIIISGGTKGVGKFLALECLKLGAKVIIGGRDAKAFNIISKQFDKENLDFVYTDLNNLESLKQIFIFVKKKFGRLDGFINYAGVTPIASLIECDIGTYNHVMDINLKAAFFNVQNAIKLMQKNGGGSIILIGSSHAERGEKNRAPYAISKGALLTLQNHIVAHYSTDKIRCNYITMGWTPTEGELELRKQENITEAELLNLASKKIPMGRMINTSEITTGIIYLLSDAAQMVTGSNIKISGGEII